MSGEGQGAWKGGGKGWGGMGRAGCLVGRGGGQGGRGGRSLRRGVRKEKGGGGVEERRGKTFTHKSTILPEGTKKKLQYFSKVFLFRQLISTAWNVFHMAHSYSPSFIQHS